MADHRALLQYLGVRLLGEKFDVDEWEPPAGLVEQISKPSAEIAAVRDDFATALEAIAHRVAALENPPTALPAATYAAVQRAVDARLAGMPQPTGELRQIDQSALADVSERLTIMEAAIAKLRTADDGSSVVTYIDRLEAVEANAAASLDLIPQLGEMLRAVTTQMREVSEISTDHARKMSDLRSISMRHNRHLAAIATIVKDAGAA